MIYAFSARSNDAQVRAMSMNDLLNVELVKRQSQEVRSVLERNPDGTVEGARRRSVWKACTVDTWRSRLACRLPWRNTSLIKFTRKEPNSCSRLMVSDVLEDQNQNSLTAHKEKARVKEGAIPVAPGRMKVTGKRGDCKQSSSTGSCSGGTKMCVQAR